MNSRLAGQGHESINLDGQEWKDENLSVQPMNYSRLMKMNTFFYCDHYLYFDHKYFYH